MESKALGRGLAALIPEKGDVTKDDSVSFVATQLIRDNRYQPRTVFDETKLNELVSSIKEKGVLQPILVRPVDQEGHLLKEEEEGKREKFFEVIAGERRLKAARILSLEKVPAIIKRVADQEALVIALIENIQREELNPIEEAEAYQRLIEEFRFSQETVAQNVGKDRSTISNILRLLKLPPEIKNSLSHGQISFGHARALLGIEEASIQKKLFDLVVKKGLSVRELENLVRGKARGGTRRERGHIKSGEWISLEEGLQKVLGTKVRIIPQKKRGRIVIEYYSAEDLDRIIRIMIKQ